jgi:sulfate permease, SulP family
MAGLSGTFVVNGSPTQTAMVESAGAQSQVAQLATAATVTLVLLFLAGPLKYLPQCVLGAQVFMIAIRLIKLPTLLAIRRESPGEFALALTTAVVVTAVVVIAVDVEQGILLAMVLSLFRVVQHSYYPHTGVMVLTETGTWNLNPLASGAMTESGLVMYRFGAALFYANDNRFAEAVNLLVEPSPSQVRWLIVDAEAITRLDYSEARVVRELQQTLTNCGTELGLARMSWDLKADFARQVALGRTARLLWL